MIGQFQHGNKICGDIDMNKSCWRALFEPYLFFEGYKNFLQIDIVAADVDDLRNWKGWVESRLRQLTLMIERDTFWKLQCHPYPREYIDPSKKCLHNAFFMGLQRKEGEVVQEGCQFDIRASVEEFRHSVNSYMFWKPGMDIHVSHIRRRQIPCYVFPNGLKRSRPSRSTAQLKKSPTSFHGNELSPTEPGEKNFKRKHDDRGMGQNVVLKKHCVSPPVDSLTGSNPCLHAGDISVHAVSDCLELKNVKSMSLSNCEQDQFDRRMSPESGTESASNSSGVTSVSSNGGSSPEDVGSAPPGAFVEDSAMAVEAMISGRFEDTTIYMEDSVKLGNNTLAGRNNDVLQNELQAQLEPIAMSGMFLDAKGTFDKDTVQNTVIRRLSLTSTA